MWWCQVLQVCTTKRAQGLGQTKRNTISFPRKYPQSFITTLGKKQRNVFRVVVDLLLLLTFFCDLNFQT